MHAAGFSRVSRVSFVSSALLETKRAAKYDGVVMATKSGELFYARCWESPLPAA